MILGIIVFIAVALIVLISVSYKLVLCDDKLLPLDECKLYLNEKYSQLPIIAHFLEKYDATGGLGLHLSMFNVDGIYSQILEEKQVASIEMSLKTSSITYQCQDLTRPAYLVIVNMTNPTIEDIDNNYCW